MDNQDDKLENTKNRRANKTDFPSKRLCNLSLKDVSLEDRRKEAKKPLFLTRYE